MNGLNEKQSEAINFFKGKMLVLAGPGSGKTTVIIHRVKTLLEKYKVNEKNILVITFTKAAADEMKNRFQKIYGANKVLFATFHSFFFRIIRHVYNISVENIFAETEKKNLIKQIINNNFDFNSDEDFLKDILNEIGIVKNELLDINFYNSKSCASDDFKKIFLIYEGYKKKHKKIDFDDMLSLCHKILTKNKSALEFYKSKYKFILIDEFQDINRAQYECIKLLTTENLFVVGDDDQSIYKFRGARPEFLLDFKKDFGDAKIIILDKNYRSSEKIILFCNKVIAQNKNRYQKKTSGRGLIGIEPKILKFDDINDEAKKIAAMIKKNNLEQANDTAIIFRTNIQAQAFIINFMNLNIDYKLKDEVSNLYDNWVSQDILAYIKFCLDQSDIKSLGQIINRPKRFISKEMFIRASKKSLGDKKNILKNLFEDRKIPLWRRAPIEELLFHVKKIFSLSCYDCVKYIRKVIGYDNFIREFCDARKIKSRWLFEILDEVQESAKNFSDKSEFVSYAENFSVNAKLLNAKNPGVTLTTMHSAKGLEFDTVYLISAIEGLVPHEKSVTDQELEEELRLFYVGLTRAKNNLFISVIKSRYESEAKVSRFLKPFLK